MKFIIIGTGFIFRRHLDSIREVGGEIIDVCNETHGRGEEWKKVIKNPNAECIVILTPNDLHFPIASAASDAGKLVLCEKPLTINSEHAKELAKRNNIFVVQQLRYHPEVIKIRKDISPKSHYDINIDVAVYRDKHYFDGWKGSKERSGGHLFTLGIHYFELLLHIFGAALEINTTYLDDKIGEGTIKGENYNCNWRVSVGARIDEPWKRIFTINGKSINLSSKENLAEENLHKFVYQDLLKGRGVRPGEVVPAIELIEKIYESYNP